MVDRDSRCCHIMSRDLSFDFRHMRESFVPACLQLSCDQSIGRIRCVALPEGAVGCIARCFEIAFEGFADLISQLACLFLCSNSSRNRPGANDGEKCILNGVVDAQTAEGDAARLGVVHPTAAATVARNMMLYARVSERQLAPAASCGWWCSWDVAKWCPHCSALLG